MIWAVTTFFVVAVDLLCIEALLHGQDHGIIVCVGQNHGIIVCIIAVCMHVRWQSDEPCIRHSMCVPQLDNGLMHKGQLWNLFAGSLHVV